MLGQLNITLINRSEQYNDTSLKAIFRLNNSHHILKCLIGNQQIFNLIKIVEPNCEQTYYKLIEEHKQLYLQGWSKLLSFIEVTEDYTVHGHKLKIKDRCSLKDKFAVSFILLPKIIPLIYFQGELFISSNSVVFRVLIKKLKK